MLITSVPLVFTHKAHEIVERPVSCHFILSVLDLSRYTERVKLLCAHICTDIKYKARKQTSHTIKIILQHITGLDSAQPLTSDDNLPKHARSSKASSVIVMCMFSKPSVTCQRSQLVGLNGFSCTVSNSSCSIFQITQSNCKIQFTRKL